jgi:TonB-linked SusC/RagA family outer membrane protein
MRKLFFTLSAIFFLLVSSIAQNRTITGKVTDDKGLGIPRASVLVKGTQIGTTTDTDGNFSLSVPANARTLVISSVDMISQELPVSGSTVDAVLKGKSGSLEEVVVVGFGVSRKKRDEAGAISSVGAKQLENKPNVSLDKAIQGRAAGVLVQANNGIPGGAINVRIRGAGSINAGNSPLYIVDGLQLNTRSDANFTQANPLAYLNPDDIQSIDIIKDAASAAIYGSNAANGVVIITTKKGRSGKTRFTFNTYYGRAQLLKKLETTNSQQYFQLRSEATGNSQNLPANDLSIKRIVLGEMRIPGASNFSNAQADSAVAALQTFDFQDAAFRKGTIKNYELSASGGNEKTTFRISANVSQQNTIITKADFTRVGLKADLTNKPTDRLTFGTSLSVSTFNQKVPFATSGSFLGSPAFSAAGILPFNRIFNDDGTFFGVPGSTPANLAGTLNQNIIQVNTLNSGNNRTNQLVGNINTDYKITNWLSFKTYAGLDYRFVEGRRVTDPRTADGFNVKGRTSVQSNTNTNIYTYGTLNFNTAIREKNKIDARVGYEYRRENNVGITAAGIGFPTFQFNSLQNAATPESNGEFFTGFRRNAVFGDFNYSYNSKYIIGLVGRYDGSSRFGSNFRHNLFYGIKTAWNIDRESFLENSKVISALRLRASYGTTGNDQIGNFDALGLFGGGGLYNGNAGIAFTQLANPELRFEKTALKNIGLDMGLLNNRLRFVFEVYDKITSDVLLDLPLQSSTGFTSLAFNVGKTQNKGVEVSLDAEVIKSARPDGFNFGFNFNFAYNQQKVKELFGGNDVLPGNVGIRVGQPIDVLFTQRYAGVNAATGRPLFFDSLGNITQLVLPRDRVVLGPQLLAPYYGGFSPTFSFKGFTLDALFNYEYGRFVSDGQINFLREASGRINFLTDIFENRFTTPGQLTSVPRQNLSTEAKSSGNFSGDRTFFKADYIRLRNVELAYSFPSSLLTRAKLNSAKFYVQGTNLYTYSDAFSYDVEFVGTATGIIPQTKNITVGLQIGF